jgi:hypothetical protein
MICCSIHQQSLRHLHICTTRQQYIFSPHPYSYRELRRYGKHNRQDDGAISLQSPLYHYRQVRTICIGERLGCDRQVAGRTLSLNNGSSCTSFTDLAGRCRLELKSDGKISSKSAKGGEGLSASACVLVLVCEDSLASAEQTASDRKRTFRTAAVVRNRLEERRY